MYTLGIITKSDYQNADFQSLGWCSHCIKISGEEVEPDGRDWLCHECGNYTLFGIEEALIQGLIELED